MMDILKWRSSNAPPGFLDFEISDGKKEKQHFTHLGEPCKWMGYISESDWISREGSECSDLSSDESLESVQVTQRKKEKIKSPSSKTKASKLKLPTKHEIENRDEGKTTKKHKKRHDSRWSGVEYSDTESSSVEQDIKPRVKSMARSIKSEEPEQDWKPRLGVTGAFGEYHCKVCNITVNSETTLETHMQGKRHRKELKARSIPDVAMQSLSLMEGGIASPDYIAPKPARRHLNNERSLIQSVAEDYKKGPVPALSYVKEIRTASMKDYTYHCQVCDAQCAPVSIMCHLTGYKHYLNSLKTFDRDGFDRYELCRKKEVEHLIIKKLEAYEAKYGRGLIVVEEEIPQSSYPSYDQPGPSWRNDDVKTEVDADSAHQDFDIGNTTGLSSREDLDTSFNDYRCIVCDAHMNNVSMWEAHVRGKRHLKNKKRVPGENASKIKATIDPNATAHLMRLLDDVYDPIVGLDFIKETQGEIGDLYNCFLCGACCSSFDIIEHLKSSKHRTKFLEKAHKKGQKNDINGILAMREISAYFKDNMIENECNKHVQEYGSGKVQVYISKDVISQPYRKKGTKR